MDNTEKGESYMFDADNLMRHNGFVFVKVLLFLCRIHRVDRERSFFRHVWD